MAVFCLGFLLLSGSLAVEGFLLTDIQCQYLYDHLPDPLKAACDAQQKANQQPQSCDNEHKRDHINQLWKDWHMHGDDNTVKQLHHDIKRHIYAIRKRAISTRANHYDAIHDEAYIHQDTTPDYQHVLHLVFDRDMNTQCRIDIMTEIERVMQINATHSTTVKYTYTQKTTTQAPKPMTQAPKMTTQNQITTNTITSNKTLLNVPYTCDKMNFFTALLHNSIMNHSNAGLCSDGTHTRSEALVIDVCNVPVPSRWKQGLQVVPNCHRIPQYSPIAMFLFDQYAINGNELSGVFIECVGNGLKAAFQLCGHGPKIFNLTVGNSDRRQDASSYYVIS